MSTTLRTIGPLVLLAVATGSAGLRGQAGGLTGSGQIARVYDAILDARFEQVPNLLTDTCEPVGVSRQTAKPPAPVCDLLGVVSLLWQIQLNPLDRSQDVSFEQRANAAIAAIEAWTRAEPTRAEAWFYLGGAYGARGQWRVLRSELLSAARDGKRIKESLERALVLNPALTDAYFGIGLYHYYADVAPAAAKILRFLLLLPAGDKARGLREMLQARDGGQLLRSEADYQLHVIYLWYEHQPVRARDLVTGLMSRYPRNPHFPQVIAEINDTYLHDDTATLRAWQSMLSAARAGRLAFSRMAEVRARLGLAVQLDRLHESDAALDELRAVTALSPTAPFGSAAEAALLRGQMLDRLGSRSDALAAYRQAVAAVGDDDPLRISARARTGLRAGPAREVARAYSLSVQGWRALERGALQEADRLLAESVALKADEPVARYRQARLRMAQGNPREALALLESLTAARAQALPPTFLGYTLLDAAALHEQGGQRQRAIDSYSRAARTFGADERTKDAAERALARLGVIRSPRGE